jgi:hypothetical protein
MIPQKEEKGEFAMVATPPSKSLKTLGIFVAAKLVRHLPLH